MPMNLPGVTVFGRPIKPVAFGFCLLMLITTVYNVLDAGALGSTVLAAVVAVLAAGAATTLALGWWASSQQLAEWGLICTAMVEMARAAFIVLTLGLPATDAVGSMIAAIIAYGSYMLEAWDDPHHHHRRQA